MGVSYRRQLLLKGIAIGKPVNWMNFYIFTRLPIMLISGIFSFILNFSTYQSLGGLSQPMYTLLYIILGTELLHYALSFFTYTNMKKTKPLGYFLNMAVLLLDCVSIGLTQGFLGSIQAGFQSGMQMGLLSFAVGVGIWFVPNFIYFRKRKGMFYLPEQRDTFQETLDQILSGKMPPFMDRAASMFGGVNPFAQAPSTTVETVTPQQTKPEGIRSDLYTYCPFCGEVIEKQAEECSHCHQILKKNTKNIDENNEKN